MKAKPVSFLESVDLYFNRASKALKLPKGLARQIRTCNAICEMKFGVELRGGYESLLDGERPTANMHSQPKEVSGTLLLLTSRK